MQKSQARVTTRVLALFSVQWIAALAASWFAASLETQAGPIAFSSVGVSGPNLVVSGSGGIPGGTYYLMGSTNYGVPPLASWTILSTNLFASNGKFTNTIPIVPTVAQDLFIIYSAGVTVSNPTPVLAYGFDDGSGVVVTDASPNAITGTINGAAWTPGWFGNALAFDGLSSYVDAGNPTPLQMTGSMTLEAWVMATGDVPDDGQIVAKSDSLGPSVGWQFKTSPDTGVRTFAIAISPDGSALVQRYSTTIVSLNTWYHVAGVYNAAAQTLDIYVNGMLDDGAISASVPASQFDSGQNVLIGRRASGWYFDGVIDEVRVYNVPLNQAGIQMDMNTPIGVTPTAPGNLVAMAVNTNLVNLNWTPSIARLGVSSYLVERQGPVATNFTQIGSAASTSYSDGTVAAYSTYGYRVRATDGVGDTGPYSGVAQAFTGLTITPHATSLTFTRTQQFSVNLTNAGMIWSVDGTVGGSIASGTITVGGLYSPPSSAGKHTVTVTMPDMSQSANASAYIIDNPGVFTYHNDNMRTGQNTNETVLTPALVNSTNFGKLFSYPVDGTVYAMPLYAADVNIPGQGYHNVVYVATGHDTVYAFDADGLSTTPLWQVSFINPAAGITTIPAADTDPIPANCCDLSPEVGITSTPVIDPASGTLYVSVTTREISGNTTNYVQRLHALDMTTGNEKFGGPVVMQASVPGTGDGSQGGMVPFIPLHEGQRPGLLLNSNIVYLAFAGHDDVAPYHGWVLGYNYTNLQRVAVFNSTPNGSDGGIWHGGGGVACDQTGSVYVVTGNGTFDANTGGSDYGDSVIKLSPTGAYQDYFTPHNQSTLDANDLDFSSGGLLLLPDQPGANPHLLISSGKTGVIFVINRDNMGHYRSNNDNQVVQVLSNAIQGGTADTGVFKPPIYYNGYVYFGPVNDSVRAFKLTSGMLSTSATSVSPETYSYPGAAITISANGNTNGIVWAVQRNGTSAPGVLYAYDTRNLTNELYNSTQAGTRDTLDVASKFTPPLIVNGKVFVGSMSQLTAYGLLP